MDIIKIETTSEINQYGLLVTTEKRIFANGHYTLTITTSDPNTSDSSENYDQKALKWALIAIGISSLGGLINSILSILM